jgi:hypothetical protein
LIIPFFLGLTLIFVSFTGRSQALTLQSTVNEIVTGLKMPGAPPVDILRGALLVMGILDGVICLGLVLLFFLPRFLFSSKAQVNEGGTYSLNLDSGERKKWLQI